MRTITSLFVLCLCFVSLSTGQSQTPELIEAARRVAYPPLPASAEPASSSLLPARATDLGCDLIGGLPLPDPVEARRLLFEFEGAPYAVHISADGSLAQVCDERFPNLGAGTQPVSRIDADSDGDGLADPSDDCPQISGVAAAARPGCPQASAADRDGDGSPDHLDRCPEQAGAAAAEGCAIMRDEDGDGVPDHIDICRADFGLIRADFALGCPADGSGVSSRRRAADEICRVSATELPIYDSREDTAAVVSRAVSANVIGRSAALDWYQATDGWVRAGGALLTGACYNIPLVNPAIGSATGCFMRPSSGAVNVRAGPGGRQAARLHEHEQQAVLGANASGDWLFYRAGWVSRSVLELAGDCASLPVLNPAQAASGTVHFCPPEYSSFLPPRIGIGESNARIASTTLANRLRAEPDYRSEQVGEIPPRTVIDAVLDGPACNSPWVWWLVEVDGQVGWTVESDVKAYHYYLEPVAAGSANARAGDDLALSETVQSPSNRQINSATLDSLDTVALLRLPSPIAVVWSPGGRALAAVSARGDIALFSGPDFAPISLEPAPPAAASAIAFSPDGKWLAAGDRSGDLRLIELSASLQALKSIPLGSQAGPIRGLAWNKAGDKLAAISGDEALKISRQAGALTVWRFDASAPAASELVLRYHYAYPLTSAAFSRDGRWLAVNGESSGDRRAALWVYEAGSGDPAFSQALVPMRGRGFVLAPPTAALGDFVYSSGDSLYQLRVDSGEDRRFYHLAGAVMSAAAFRPQVIPGAEALVALSAEERNGRRQLRIANALNPRSSAAAFLLTPSATAFSPDGRLLAIAEAEADRVRVLGVAAQR